MSQKGNAGKKKCPSTTKADRNQPHGRTGQVQQGRQVPPSPTSSPREKCSSVETMWKAAARGRAKCPQPSLERVGQLQDQTPPGYIGSNATKGKGRKGVQRPALSLCRLNTTNGQEGSELPGPDPPQQRQWLKPLQGQSRTECPSGGLRR